MEIISSTILNQEPSRGKIKITFSFTADDGTVFGPYVEHRPSSSTQQEISDYVESRKPTIPLDYYAIMQAQLDGYVGAGAYDSVRKALKDLGAESIALDGLPLNVTYPDSPFPEDVEIALKTRIDADLGENKYEVVKAVLKGMGFNQVSINRKSEVAL